MKRLLDLRFVIGVFFFVVGILLLLYSFFSANPDQSVNRWCGGIFIIFSIIMFIFSFKTNDEESY
jgi:uncharacterized membrane protein HdeD (DUF308 family)